MVKWLVDAIAKLWCYSFHPWVQHEGKSTYYGVPGFGEGEVRIDTSRYCKKCGRR